MKDTNVQKEVDDWVGTLPITVWGLKRRLRRKGVRGIMGSSNSCPVANLLKRELPEFAHASVSVTGSKIRVISDGHSYGVAATPHNVLKFIKQFDSGEAREFLSLR